jgi:hypothetical protein
VSTTTTRPAPAGARGWVGLALVLLVGTLLLTLANLGRAGSTEPLHPQNPEGDGARAVARVLEQQGVEVDVVGSDAALGRATLDRDTTLVVTSTEELGSSTYAGLRDAVQRAGTTVLVSPPAPVLSALGLDARVASVIGGDLEAECDLPLLADLTLQGGGTSYAAPGGTTCFRTGPGAELPGLVAVTGDTFLLGAAGVLTNASVDEADNAAVALRLLGQHPRLVWYHATDADLRAGDARADADHLAAVLPDWLVPALLLLTVAVLLALLWQGRRFGPLVVEPLPVTVRADETEASRGRLYRAARDPQHAADTLRADARAAWRERLHLPPTAPVETVAGHLAQRPGSPDRATLRALLEDGPVTDDRALLRLAADLAALHDPPAAPRKAPGKDRP